MVRYVILLIAFLISGFAPALSVSDGAYTPLTNGEWVNFALWKLEANGLTGPVFISSRPYERQEIAQIIARVKKRIEDGSLNPTPLELGLINKLETEFAGDLNPQGLEVRELLAGEVDYQDEWGKASASLWGAASFHPATWVTLYEEIDVKRGREIVGEEGRTASRRMNPWRWDYTADFRRAYISLHPERFQALLGRQSLFWGPAYGGSLILSDNSPTFDMLLLEAKFGPVEAAAFSAVLDNKWSQRGNPPYRYLAYRYLSGHRVHWIVNDRVQLGLCELVLYGGEVRDMELQYMNPLLPYYASQWNEDQDDNVLVSADFSVKPVDKLRIYGQFLVDDFQYSGSRPHALGYTGGFYLSDPLRLSGTDLRSEYSRISTFTYTHRLAENQFTHYGWIMGHHLGPDADQLLVELSRMINLDIRLKLRYTYERQGSHTVVDRYVDEDFEHIDFPSGTVERRHNIRLQFLWEPARGPQVDISCGGVFIHSQGNITREGELSVTAGFFSGMEWFRNSFQE